MKNQVIVICGSTGSGKSNIAVELAKKIDGEIISADSIAIYKELNIGTAKPTKEEMQGIKHYLIDEVSPFSSFTVSDYEERATSLIEDILKRGKTPIICGGTGYYINSVLYKFSYGNTGENKEVREKYNKLKEEYGNEYIYNMLKEVDEESAKKLSVNDTMRVIRALEIYEVSGVKKSSIKDDLTPRFPFTAFMPTFLRSELYERINLRVDKMIEKGLINEVKELIALGLNEKYQSMQGIGYKEILEGIKENKLELAIENIKLNSRHYAKRQITYFKRMNNLTFLDGTKNANLLADEIIKTL